MEFWIGAGVVVLVLIYAARRSPSPGDAANVSRPTRRELRADIGPGRVRLIQGPPISVVGESHYRPAIQRVVGKRQAAGHKVVVDAELVWQPDNRYDPNAIAVIIAGAKCGHLSRADAVRYRPVMERLRHIGLVPVVRADIYGGFQRDDGDWADFGITLYVAKPEKLLEHGDLAERPVP